MDHNYTPPQHFRDSVIVIFTRERYGGFAPAFGGPLLHGLAGVRSLLPGRDWRLPSGLKRTPNP